MEVRGLTARKHRGMVALKGQEEEQILRQCYINYETQNRVGKRQFRCKNKFTRKCISKTTRENKFTKATLSMYNSTEK